MILRMPDFILFLTGHQGFEFYFLLALALAAGACYIPITINSDLTIITVTGISAATGLYDIPTLFVSILSGILIGDLINFSLAKKFGPKFIQKPLFQKIIHPQQIKKWTPFFKKYDARIIFLIRFLPFLRTLLFFISGLMQVPRWKFLIFNGLSTSLYLISLMFISYQLGTYLNPVSFDMFKFQLTFILIIIFILCLFYFQKKWRQKIFNHEI